MECRLDALLPISTRQKAGLRGGRRFGFERKEAVLDDLGPRLPGVRVPLHNVLRAKTAGLTCRLSICSLTVKHSRVSWRKEADRVRYFYLLFEKNHVTRAFYFAMQINALTHC